jgi:hypothetical protein
VTARATVDALRDVVGVAPLGAAAQDALHERLAAALETIGWRGDDLASAEELAAELLPAIEACARDHRDLDVLERQIAEVLRASGPVLDGSLPPTAAYLPAASEVVRLFTAPR